MAVTPEVRKCSEVIMMDFESELRDFLDHVFKRPGMYGWADGIEATICGGLAVWEASRNVHGQGLGEEWIKCWQSERRSVVFARPSLSSEDQSRSRRQVVVIIESLYRQVLTLPNSTPATFPLASRLENLLLSALADTKMWLNPIPLESFLHVLLGHWCFAQGCDNRTLQNLIRVKLDELDTDVPPAARSLCTIRWTSPMLEQGTDAVSVNNTAVATVLEYMAKVISCFEKQLHDGD